MVGGGGGGGVRSWWSGKEKMRRELDHGGVGRHASHYCGVICYYCPIAVHVGYVHFKCKVHVNVDCVHMQSGSTVDGGDEGVRRWGEHGGGDKGRWGVTIGS